MDGGSAENAGAFFQPREMPRHRSFASRARCYIHETSSQAIRARERSYAGRVSRYSLKQTQTCLPQRFA